MSRVAAVAATLAIAVGASASAAVAAPHMLVGLTDDAGAVFEPQSTFPLLSRLRAQVIRANLDWSRVAAQRPAAAADPADPAYDWSAYDAVVRSGAQRRIKVVFSIVFTPAWSNGGRGRNVAPTDAEDLRRFAAAAARRYSGSYTPTDAATLPAVPLWTAWNEPNNPVFLTPQFRGRTLAAAQAYVRICNAVYSGVHATALAGERVACGVTAPRGNDAWRSSRPSIDPLAFLRGVKRYGLRRFDVWAHHPYAISPGRALTARPEPGTVSLANIGSLTRELSRLYGPKHLWITEIGWQTNPPDEILGVSYARQALLLRQAYALGRRNPRIDMMLWFLLRDEPRLTGWQSGLLTASGKQKPAFSAFAQLPH